MKAKFWWIKERHNPQFKKPSYTALGNIGATAASAHSETMYGENIVRRFDSKEAYESELGKLRAQGFTVHTYLELR